MGMDSLTAMELRTRLEQTLQASLPSTLAFDYTTVETLTDYLTREVTLSAGLQPPASCATRERTDRTAQDIEHMPDEEVELLLIEKLEHLGYA